MIAAPGRNRINEAAAYEFLGQLAAQETNLGYDAITANGKRRQSPVRSLSEDRELTQSRRNQLNANARDQVRNFAVAAWAIRKHLDFVSRFTFDCTSGDAKFDDQVEKLMEEASQKDNWDIAGRHDRDRWMRLFEARACVDGDVLGVMLKSGHLQAIESDRIRSRDWIDSEKLVHGVKIDDASRALAFQIHKRQFLGGFVFEREVSASNCVFHGYFDRFDQVRGISPLAPGLNSLQDLYENFDYALAKMKVSQLFGVAWTRSADEAPGPLSEDATEEEPDGPRYDVTFGTKPLNIDLDPGDGVEIIESKQPSDQFREFSMAMIMVSLKALDIPYCFFDESFTNFYGSKSAVTLYIESCKTKRGNLKAILNQIALWKIRQWVAAGRLILPAGMKPETVPIDWIHAGLPWWDPAKEVNADDQSVKSGFRSRAEIRKERFGDDWYKIIDQLAKEQEYAAKKGVILDSQVLPPQPTDPMANDVPAKPPKPKARVAA